MVGRNGSCLPARGCLEKSRGRRGTSSNFCFRFFLFYLFKERESVCFYERVGQVESP